MISCNDNLPVVNEIVGACKVRTGSKPLMSMSEDRALNLLERKKKRLKCQMTVLL